MKNRKLGRQIFGFLIITTIINAGLMFLWFAFKSFPVLSQLENFKGSISHELNKEYNSVSEFCDNLSLITSRDDVGFRLEDENKNVLVNEDKKGIVLFSDIINIQGDVYFVRFISSKSINFMRIVVEGILFQVIEVTFLFVITYLSSRSKIIKPTESIVSDIRNYKLGVKPKLKDVHDEFDIIHNEFVNLTNELDKEKIEQNRIIASISHDLKTPLTSIIGYADLIREEDDEVTIKRYNEKISNKAMHIKDILSMFDDYLVNYDKTPLNLSEITIRDIVNSLNNDYKIELENNNIKFKVITKIRNDIIRVDVLKLKRIFSNLISNAIRYIDKDGEIIIEIEKVDNKYRFIVSDNGIGVDDKIIDKIFNPFYTTDKSRKISGLGLSICHEFVEMHKGEIRAYNNNGLTIEFDIPE